jgi:myo-inositol-1(or 4)-monophosphatase
LIELASNVAKEAGKLIRDGRANLQVSHKGPVDLVTQLDLASEDLIRERFTRAEPSIPILAEENGGAINAKTRWIIDPLDGTTNFVHDFPFYCVSIALEQDGVLTHGVIYDIPNDRLYTAVQGQGAHCDGRPLKVSTCNDIDKALIASGFAADRRQRADFYLAFVKHFIENAQGFRRCGSAAMDLAMLADGRLDAYWEFGLNAWDVAAGALIVAEAGGRVGEISGGPLNLNQPQILATNANLFNPLLQHLGPLLAETC